LLVSIREEFGYGDMMHNFKDYLLLGAEKIIARVDIHYRKLNAELKDFAALKSVFSTKEDASNAISVIVASYYRSARVVEGSFKAGTPLSQIDKTVKVGDETTAEAFEILRKE
jgi:methyl-accepting chemotaxis protein